MKAAIAGMKDMLNVMSKYDLNGFAATELNRSEGR
jgi:hypothetical protein